MIILHAGLVDRSLHLWGEQSIPVEPPTPRVRGTRHPYDAGVEGLKPALHELSITTKQLERRSVNAIAWLPSAGGAPVPSSPLIAEPPPARSRPALTGWAVTSLPLRGEEMVEFLCLCMNRRTLAPGLVIGADLAYWSQALRFAGALVARQQYLPGIRAEGARCRAVWTPVLAGHDAERLAAAARRMPPAARSLAGPRASGDAKGGRAAEREQPPEAPAVEILRLFIEEAVDHLVRSAFIEYGVLSRRRPMMEAPPESPHDAWLKALRLADSLIPGDPGELRRLAEQVEEWRRPISIGVSLPFRLCFRLEEPPDGAPPTPAAEPESAGPAGDRWRVRYLLQPHDDPSLLIPVQDAWRERGRAATALKRHAGDAREYILSALGQAAGVCAGVASSLETAEPAGFELDSNGAYDFLRNTAAGLEQAGFGVMLPGWWTQRHARTRLSARARVKSPAMEAGMGLSLDELIHFDWEVSLGEKTISRVELERLARLKAPLVRLRGKWVEVTPEEIEAAIALFKGRSSGRATARDVVLMALGARDTVGGVHFEGVSASGWVGKLLGQLNGRASFKELPAPAGFHGQLRPYQVRGYSWLRYLKRWGLGACLADDMGLGKTIQALALIQRDWESGDRRPVLLVCPTSVVNNWQKEAARFTPGLPVLVHHGVGRRRGDAFRRHAAEQAIVVSSYALLHRDLEHLRGVDWAGVILDEAQNIKNPETRQAHAARAIARGFRLALTGTPVENNVGDLWSIMEFLNPGFLGTPAEFRRTFFVPIQAGRDPEAARRLKRITGPFVLRRLKTDRAIISDLPEKQEMKVFCPLTREQAGLYAGVLRDLEDQLGGARGIQRRGVILATLSKLKQVCNHPAQFLGDHSAIPGRSGKLARLTEMLEEILEVGERALVFSQFAEMGGILQKHLQETFGREILFLYGAVPRGQRDRMVERFQESEGGPPIFILSLKAGGTGLNLTRASHVFHFDRWWNPAVENQATDRAFRIGQTKNVQIHKFICAGTLEEKIDEMIEGKKTVAESIVGAGEGWLTELSTKELREVLALREEAVGDQD